MEDNTKIDLKVTGYEAVEWIHLAQGNFSGVLL
jgi:hypothetical protein